MTQEIFHYNGAENIDEIVIWLDELVNNKEKKIRIVQFQIISNETYLEDYITLFDCVVVAETTDLRFSWDTVGEEDTLKNILPNGWR